MSTRTSTPATRRERRALERQARTGHGSPGHRPAPVARRTSPWRSPFVVVTIVAVVVMAGAVAALALTSNRGPAPDTLGLVAPPDSGAAAYADGSALGDADAPVVLEVYADFQCPWCGKFARENLPSLIRTFVATGDLRIEERDIAFLGTTNPDESLDAATAAACAAPTGRYWQFHDYLSWNQSGENQGAFSRTRLAAMADRIGLDAAAFASCLDDPATREAVVARTQAAFDAGIDSTPTFVLDGEQVTVSAFADLASLIQAKVDAAAAS